MDRKQRYVLMHQDDEVLSFEVSFAPRNDIRVLELLKHSDKAPFPIEQGMPLKEINCKLSSYFYRRAIPFQRYGYEEILKYTGSLSAFELSFKGHGLSLSDHFWLQKEGESLKYKDINFFDNGWDDSFGRALLRGDFESLEHLDLNVPDIVTPGWGIKGWLYEDGVPHLYKKGIANGHCEEPLAEVLSSRLAQRLFAPGEAMEYELREIDGAYASVSKSIIGPDEMLLPLQDVLPEEVNKLYSSRDKDHGLTKKFFESLASCEIPGLVEFFVKISCFRSIGFVNDLHFQNLSAIKNLRTGKIRLAPVFDFGSSFGSSQKGRAMLSTVNKGTYLIVYFIFSDLEKDWDYSWYHKENLIGFEDEIRDLLSKSDFYTPTLIDNIIDVYHRQLDALNKLAGQ